MNRRQINALYKKMEKEAHAMVLKAVAEYCKKHKLECITDGPWGMMLAKDGLSKELKIPKKLADLDTWYRSKFGVVGAYVNVHGEWTKK